MVKGRLELKVRGSYKVNMSLCLCVRQSIGLPACAVECFACLLCLVKIAFLQSLLSVICFCHVSLTVRFFFCVILQDLYDFTYFQSVFVCYY